MLNKFAFTLLICVGAFSLRAQDPQFTQFYAAPLYLNPAFTGLTYEHRFALNMRDQWPGVNTAYKTGMVSYDYNLSDVNSGIGGYFLQDIAGTSRLITQQTALNFAYRMKVKKYSEFRFGASAALTKKRFDYSRLIFNDQLSLNSPPASASNEPREDGRVNYLDIGVGGLYNSTNYWVGAALKHINQPNTSMTGGVLSLPVSVSMHGGYRYIITARGAGRTKLEEFVSASVNYRHELRYDQLDIGAYYFKSFLNVGVWYRGLPLKKYKPGYSNRETVAILVGLEVPDKNFRIGYSYDLTVSRLGINNTQGSHEVSMVYEIAKKRKRTKRALVSCPKF